MISVKKINATTFEVVVDNGAQTTHIVTLSTQYCQKLTNGQATPEELIRKSFEFLLEREPNTSILRSFDLPVIGNYFPEYEGTMMRG